MNEKMIAIVSDEMANAAKLMLQRDLKASWKSANTWKLLLKGKPEEGIMKGLEAMQIELRTCSEDDLKELGDLIEDQRSKEMEKLKEDPTFSPEHDLTADRDRAMRTEHIPRWRMRQPGGNELANLWTCRSMAHRSWPNIELLIKAGKAQASFEELVELIASNRGLDLERAAIEEAAHQRWLELLPRPLSPKEILELPPSTELWGIWNSEEEEWCDGEHIYWPEGGPPRDQPWLYRLPAVFLSQRAAHLAADQGQEYAAARMGSAEKLAATDEFALAKQAQESKE